ncbi:MAG: glycosyltransferase [Nitrospiraceae bacterium]|nr:glycosyltransferase [Nitrospiraceae bacterium]
MYTEKVRNLPDNSADIPAEPFKILWDLTIIASIVAALFFIVYASIFSNLFQPVLQYARTAQWTRFIVRPSVIWATMGSLLLVFRTILWFWYRPAASATWNNAPSVTAIIPAYNEGQMVEKSIDSVAAASYPREKLELIVIDDGSKDDTWHYIMRAALRHPGLVKPIRFPENRGKRAALEEGFQRAEGEVAVTIDSDSVIERDTLLSIAGPFRNPRVGAVAGKVSVFNKEEGIIPRMLHVRFILSFDFLRAAQSTYGAVYCCPGALSAYRLSAIRQVLGRWMKQTFLGESCTYGEDRSMTNFILSEGYDTVYQRTAVVHTVAPATYTKMSRMYLRWERSYIKEELRLFKVLWKRPLLSRLITLVDVCVRNLRFPISYAVLGLLVFKCMHDPATILRLLFAIGLMSFLNTLYYLRSERSWDFIYGILYSYFSAFTLFWIFPYALLSVRSRSWMTR